MIASLEARLNATPPPARLSWPDVELWALLKLEGVREVNHVPVDELEYTRLDGVTVTYRRVDQAGAAHFALQPARVVAGAWVGPLAR